MSRYLCILTILVACGSADDGTTTDDTPDPVPSLLDGAQRGDPGLASIDALAFQADGRALAIGDGAGDRIVAIELDDTSVPADNGFESITNLPGRIGTVMGGGEGSTIQVLDVAVHPTTHRVYVAARRTTTGEHGLFAIDGDGAVSAVDLSDVAWAAVGYPEVDGPGSTIADLAWAGDTIVASAMESAWTPSQVIAFGADPFTHGDSAAVSSTRSYHRSHRAWETTAPITSFFTFDRSGEAYLGASFTCAPVVRFRADDVTDGTDVLIGVTPFDYGGGKQVVDFATYRGADGEDQLVAAIYGLGDASTDFLTTVRTSDWLLQQNDYLDEDALVIIGFSGEVTNEEAEILPTLGGVTELAAIGDDQLVILRDADLSIVPVP